MSKRRTEAISLRMHTRKRSSRAAAKVFCIRTRGGPPQPMREGRKRCGVSSFRSTSPRRRSGRRCAFWRSMNDNPAVGTRFADGP
jgi:hypothetical protein